MNWDQIESRWAAMARRVRSDLPAFRTGPDTVAGRRPNRTETGSALVAVKTRRPEPADAAFDERIKIPAG